MVYHEVLSYFIKEMKFYENWFGLGVLKRFNFVQTEELNHMCWLICSALFLMRKLGVLW